MTSQAMPLSPSPALLAPTAPPADFAGDIARDRRRLLLKSVGNTAAPTIGALVLVGLMFWGRIAALPLLLWGAASLGVALFRYMTTRAVPEDDAALERTHRRAMAGTALAMLMWVLGVPLFYGPRLDDLMVVSVLYIILCSAGTISLSVYRPAFLLFVPGIMASLFGLFAVRAALVADGRGGSIAIAVAVALMTAVLFRLARQTDTTTTGIDTTVNELSGNIGQLIDTSSQTVRVADSVNQGVGVINGALESFNSAMSAVGEKVETISGAASASMGHCRDVLSQIDDFSEGVKRTAQDLRTADQRILTVLERGEDVMNYIAASGLRTPESRFIELIQQTSGQVSALFEEAIRAGRISQADLFDQEYHPIPGTDPQQYETRYARLTDQLLTDLQDTLLTTHPDLAFCCTIDRNGYLPTHNRKYSQPQGKDPVWNNANSRNRRIYKDRTAQRAGKNQKPFLLQTYRRDMGGGTFILMKDLSAPVMVNGQHWGAVRIGYKV